MDTQMTVGDALRVHLGIDLDTAERASKCADIFQGTMLRLGPCALVDLSHAIEEMVYSFMDSDATRSNTRASFCQLDVKGRIAVFGLFAFLLGVTMGKEFQIKEEK